MSPDELVPATPVELKLSNIDTMETIAKNEQTLDEIKQLTSNKVQDQLKVFLIAQARNELERVVKLTRFLDNIEDSFITKVTDASISDDITLKQYSEIITTITTLLMRSNEIVSKVLKDDSLTTILNTAIYNIDGEEIGRTSVISQLKDAQSRERVRSVIQSILIKSQNFSNTHDTVPQEE